MLGPSADDPVFERAEPPDPATPLLSRRHALQRTFLDDLDLFARQHNEIEAYGDEYRQQLRGEAVATLIALRELWRSVPELSE